jgi:hypothetical protein
MADRHECGPNSDTDFFNELAAVFSKFTDAAKKYNVKCVDHETHIMKVNFKHKIGVARIEGNRVVTEFEDRPPISAEAGVICCQWDHTGQIGGGTWTCTSRWSAKQ